MRRPRLVASDVDGTLLDPTDQISDRTRAAVHRVVAAGVPFILVTGRPPRWVRPIVEQLGYAGPTVCANGAVLYDAATDQISYAVTLDPVQLRDAADVVATALPGAKFAVELLTGSVAVNGAEEFLAEPGYIHPWPDADSVDAPRDILLGQSAIKLLIRQPDASSDMMAAAVRELLGVRWRTPPGIPSRDQQGVVPDVTFSTCYGLIELSAPGATKGTGLARLAGELGVAPADVLALGDMPNDLSMLQWAGYGVAMANAHPAVLEAADEITAGNSEDGLALILERWF
jgi:hydroxymethylpyrimidine pyrophosphatase-like HAD family hydrolase